MASEDEQIAAEDRAPDVGAEGGQALPGAAVEAEDALEPGDDAFDAGPEVAQLAVDPGAAGHVGDLEAAVLGEGDVAHAPGLQGRQIGFRGEAAVEGGLGGRAAVEVDLALDHGVGQRGIGGIAVEDDAVEDQRGGAAGQADLVAVERLAPILTKDVGVVFEERHDLLARGYALALEDAAAGLLDHPLAQRDEAGQLGRQGGAAWIALVPLLESFLDLARPADDLRGDAEQIPVGPSASLAVLGVEHLQPAPLGPPPTVAEAGKAFTEPRARP